MTHGLGRRVPTEWRHVERYPLRAIPALAEPPLIVEARLNVPRQYRQHYNQGSEGACVGFSLSWMMSILNRQRYDARKVYREAQLVDEWPDTPPGEGTSVRAGCDILQNVGHWRIIRGVSRAAYLGYGIAAYRWATTIDEVRAAQAAGSPVVWGINWYRAFNAPVLRRTARGGRDLVEYWIGVQGESTQPTLNLGPVDGGHAICQVACSDERQAVGLCNTWGGDYPFLVWMPYAVAERVLREGGEVCLVTDR